MHISQKYFVTPRFIYIIIRTVFRFARNIEEHISVYTAQKMKFSIKNVFSKCDQIRSLLRIWSHLLKNSLMQNFIFLCSVRK